MILIEIYSGLRPQKITLIESSNMDLQKGTLIGGIKTENGINRVVPIHPKVKPLICNRIDSAGPMLFEDMNYEKYRYAYKKIMKVLDMQHKPHETRHTFISRVKEHNVDEYCLKLIVGHTIVDLTERVYTHRRIEQLKNEMDKIQ